MAGPRVCAYGVIEDNSRTARTEPNRRADIMSAPCKTQSPQRKQRPQRLASLRPLTCDVRLVTGLRLPSCALRLLQAASSPLARLRRLGRIGAVGGCAGAGRPEEQLAAI